MQIDPIGTTVRVNSRRVQNACEAGDLDGTYMLDLRGFIPKYNVLTLPSPAFPPGLPPLVIGNDAIQGDFGELGVLTSNPRAATILQRASPA
jgi:hypothetical protein